MSNDDINIPYIKRNPGDLLTAEVWNNLQTSIKSHINIVKAIATDSEVDIVSISVDDGVTFGDESKQVVAAPLDADGKVNALADDTVTADALADGAVTTDAIADGAITADKMAPGVIPTDLLSDGSVTEIKIADGAITASKMAPGVLPSELVPDGSVTEAKITIGAVTTDKIANNAVGTNQIASNAIHGAQIAESSSVEVKNLTVTGTFSAPGMVAANGVPTGSIMPFAGEEAPAGWLLCDGESFKGIEYPALYSLIKTAYGDGTLGKDGIKIKDPYPTMPKDPYPTLPKDSGDVVKTVFKAAATKELFGEKILDGNSDDGKSFESSLLDGKIIDDKLDDTIKDVIRAVAFNVPDMRGMFMRGWDNGAGRDKEAADRKPAKAGANGGDAIGSKQSDAGRNHVHQQAGGDVGVLSGGGGRAADGQHDAFTSLRTNGPSEGNWSKYETRPMNIYVNYIIKT